MAMSEQEAAKLVGLALDEARRQVTAKGSYVTITAEDGVSFPVTAIYDTNRVCLHVEKGKVTAAKIG